MTNKLDVYSDMRIPFTVAAFCRTHKFAPYAVNLAKAMRKDTELRGEINRMQDQLEANTEGIKALVSQVEQEMEKTNAN